MKVLSERGRFERHGVVIEPGENDVPDGVGRSLIAAGMVREVVQEPPPEPAPKRRLFRRGHEDDGQVEG